MEEIILDDLSDLVKKFDPANLKYRAVFDPATRSITAIYPEHFLEDKTNSISIDREIAESINDGKIRMSACKVNLKLKKIEVVDESLVASTDTVIHRVIEKRWDTLVDFDIMIKYNSNTSSLIFTMDNAYFRGKKENIWPMETELRYFITGYNDPHIIYETISFSLGDLMKNKKKIFKKIKINGRFSVFTRNLFHYQMEIV